MQPTQREQRSGGILAWQWALYSDNHQNRRNLMLHLFAVPLFQVGSVSMVVWPLLGSYVGGAMGVATMVFSMVVQGRGHAQESVAPVPFRGPADVVLRVFAEQWITFPRYVFSGRFGAAWRRG